MNSLVCSQHTNSHISHYTKFSVDIEMSMNKLDVLDMEQILREKMWSFETVVGPIIVSAIRNTLLGV